MGGGRRCSVAGIGTERAHKLMQRTCSRCDDSAGTRSVAMPQKSSSSRPLISTHITIVIIIIGFLISVIVIIGIVFSSCLQGLKSSVRICSFRYVGASSKCPRSTVIGKNSIGKNSIGEEAMLQSMLSERGKCHRNTMIPKALLQSMLSQRGKNSIGGEAKNANM